MLNLKSLKVAEKAAEFEHPLGFKITIAYLPTAVERDIAAQCQTKKYVKGMMQDDVDTDKLYLLLSTKIIRGWEGMTGAHLKELMPVSSDSDITDETEIPYSEDNANFLLRNSDIFENWIQEHRSDLTYFNKLEEAEKNS